MKPFISYLDIVGKTISKIHQSFYSNSFMVLEFTDGTKTIIDSHYGTLYSPTYPELIEVGDNNEAKLTTEAVNLMECGLVSKEELDKLLKEKDEELLQKKIKRLENELTLLKQKQYEN